MNYRKLYEKELNTKIPKGFDIHHIDFNHDNNEMENLLMLPKALHQKLHSISVPALDSFRTTPRRNIFETGFTANNILINELIGYQGLLLEINEWSDYKFYLQGDLPKMFISRKVWEELDG